MTTTLTNHAAAIAQRVKNAHEDFAAVIEAKGFTAADAEKIVGVLLRLKAAKLDANLGRISVVHGMYLEADVLRNALNLAN